MDEQKTVVDRKSTDDLMIAEFNRTSALFLDNEQLGERRLQIFITLVSAVTALLGLTNFIPGSKDKITIYYFGLFALWVLFTFGIVTLRRVIHRNVITDQYKYLLDRIRLYFVKDQKCERMKVLNSILLYIDKPEDNKVEENKDEEIKPMKRRSRQVGWNLGYGGILRTVQILNNYLVGLIGVLTLVLISFLYSPNALGVNLANPWYILFSIAIFIGLFFLCQSRQICYIRKWYKNEEDDGEKLGKIRYKDEEGVADS